MLTETIKNKAKLTLKALPSVGTSLAAPPLHYCTEEGSPLPEFCWNAIKTARYDILLYVFVLTLVAVRTHAILLVVTLACSVAHVSQL